MDLGIKELDKNNKCNVCKSEPYDDIIISKSLMCNTCYKNINNLTVDDFEYYFYKDKIKNWLSNKYKIDMR